MNIEIFKRNISLYKLGIAELDNSERIIYEFLIENLSGLNTYISDKYPDDLYFGKSEKDIILYYDTKNEWLRVKYDNIWSFFKNDLMMEYDNIQSLTKWWVDVTLNLKPKHTNHLEAPISISVDVTLNLKPKHTSSKRMNRRRIVDVTLNLKPKHTILTQPM